ncbi:uncharacterized protein CCR75_006632 [Bremia lactucae]|uniref:Uncharacterized protein n=1 Tax=Bremia lactucae TaxID=4779 RepID=A0A976FDB2_BRELC|nr:hypothetical protein CCR75_006632 [Bremia lactucae]
MSKKQVVVGSAATYLESHLLESEGLLVLASATAALRATSLMVSYGASKAATHHLVAKKSSVLGVLPTTIDTPMNRKYIADADFSTWTKAEYIAAKMFEWSNAS